MHTSPLTGRTAGLVLFRISAPRHLSGLQGTWLEHRLTFRFRQSCNCWYAIAGVGLATKPGKYALELEGVTPGGGKLSFRDDVTIAAGHYPSIALKVAPEFVEPPKETLARIEQEQAEKKRHFRRACLNPLWHGRFSAGGGLVFPEYLARRAF